MTILVLIASLIFLIALGASVWAAWQAFSAARDWLNAETRPMVDTAKNLMADGAIVIACVCSVATALYALAKLWGYL